MIFLNIKLVKMRQVKFGPNEVYGIKELSELTDFAIAAIVLGDRELADGFQSSDLLAFFQLLPLGVKGFEGIDQIPKEVGDFSEQEAVEYMKLFDKLDLRDDEKERVARVVLKNVVKMGQAIVEIANALKKPEEVS